MHCQSCAHEKVVNLPASTPARIASCRAKRKPASPAPKKRAEFNSAGSSVARLPWPLGFRSVALRPPL